MTAPVLNGSLSSFHLPQVLTFLSTTRKSGMLTVTTDARKATFYFDDGALVYAGSNQEQFRLGSILLRKKKISQQERERIDALMLREGGRFGEIAIQNGVMSEDQLRDYLKVQVSEIVYDAFVWEQGTFGFSEGGTVPQHAVTIAIDLPNLIMEGARRIEEWEQCIKLLPDKTAVFRVVTAPTGDKITLTADEWKVLFLINGVRTLEDLCHDAEEDAFSVYRVVYGLLSNHLIESVAAPPKEDETVGRKAEEPAASPLATNAAADDATVRQVSPRFSAESTMRAPSDDTNLLVSSEARLSYADVVRPTIARLKLTSGANQGTVIPLSDAEYLLGRHRDNSIHLDDLGVSGFHARIYRGAEGYVLEDLKSRNGTWINGARVYHATLAHGDQIHVGQSDLLYEVLF
jgi:hypothetical protein